MPTADLIQVAGDGTTRPASYDLAIRRGSAGDYAAILFDVLQADGVTPVPLAGAVATMTVIGAGATVLTLTSATGGRLALDITTSTVMWVPTQAETLAIASGRRNTYDLTIVFADGSQGPYLTGYLIGLDDGDVEPSGCGIAVTGTSNLVQVIKVLVPGTPGPPGGSAIIKTAVVAISGHKAVKAVAGGIVPASSDDLASLGAVLGITTGAAAQGAPAMVQTAAEMSEPTWTWAIGRPVFLGLAGGLTQVPAQSGILQQLGVATASTSLLVDIQTPILRA